jgi:amphi-Trp domain-containing protein
MQRDEAVAYFAALVDGLRHGHLQFKQRDEALELDPAPQVAVEVKASRKGEKEKVSFELSWKTGGEPELEVSG